LGSIEIGDCWAAADMVLATGGKAKEGTARLVGLSRAAIDYAVAYGAERVTFGKRLAEHQVMAFMAADMGTAIDAGRCLLWHAAYVLDTAGPQVSELLVRSAASFVAESAVRVTTHAVQMLGGHGYVENHPVEKWLRDARTMANVSNWVARLLVPIGGGR
jgi:acyl-CoA dehydrogenase